MSNFINELLECVKCCDFHEETGTLDMIESLGENARRQLEIGILQDELVKLGFEWVSYQISDFDIDALQSERKYSHDVAYGYIAIHFHTDQIAIQIDSDDCNEPYVLAVIELSLPTWQQKVLNKVKELINE